MTRPRFINGLSEIAGDYNAMACDAWGVIHNGRELFADAAEAMIRFRETRGPVVIVTNAPKPSRALPAQLDKLGLSRAAWDGIVSSGDATRAEIERRLPAPAWRIGPSFDDPLFEGLDIDFVPMEEADFIICTGLNDGFTEEPDEYRPRLAAAAERGLLMVCANPDIIVNWGGRMMWCAGALAEIYQEYGGEVVFGGKPHASIYRQVSDVIAGARKGETPARILAVGDGLKTDILGANKAGLDALLVIGGGGLHAGASGREQVMKQLREEGLRARAVIEGLRW